MSSDKDRKIDELAQQINNLQAAYGRMVDDHAEQRKKLKDRIVELGKSLAEVEREYEIMSGWVARAMMKGCCNEDITKEAMQKFIDKRDIEQQIKALEWLLRNTHCCFDKHSPTYEEISDRIDQLRQQLNEVSGD